MQSQQQLVDRLVSQGRLRTPHCIEAFSMVDRKNYIDDDQIPASRAYMDRPLPNGPFETISAPHMHAAALELLAERLRPGAQVLDVGSGSGFLTACLAYACGPGAFVLGVEQHEDLAQASIRNLRKADAVLLDSRQVEIRCGSALSVVEEDMQFDAIHVGAAAAELPMGLCKRLKQGGLMVVPVGPSGGVQVLKQVRRPEGANGDWDVRDIMHVHYVPLSNAW